MKTRIAACLLPLVAAILIGVSPAMSQVSVGIGVRIGPPSPRYETVARTPFPHAVWIGGHWNWDRPYRRYVWLPGRWIAERAGYAWVNGAWYRGSRGWQWREGYWDHRERAESFRDSRHEYRNGERDHRRDGGDYRNDGGGSRDGDHRDALRRGTAR
jgi:hypothetical protein